MNGSPWWRIGWRNLGRNRKRTALTALGLAIGYFAVVLMIGWGEGMVAELIENATSLVSGQIEINDADYRPERSLYDTIGGRGGADVEELLNTIGADPSVVAAAPRVYAGALVSSGESTRAGMLLGVDPEREVALTRFLDPLVAGRLPATGAYEVVVGEEMARQLAVGVGDELVVVASAADGSMANDLYAVTGVFRTGLVEFDGSTAVMPIADLQTLVAFDAGRIHEIAVATTDPAGAAVTAERLAMALGAEDREIAVASWTELNPVLSQYVALADGVYWIFIVVIFGVACLGVANTMLMATFERRREICDHAGPGREAVVGGWGSAARSAGDGCRQPRHRRRPRAAPDGVVLHRSGEPGMALRGHHPRGGAGDSQPACRLQRAGLDVGDHRVAGDCGRRRVLPGGPGLARSARRYAVRALRR